MSLGSDVPKQVSSCSSLDTFVRNMEDPEQGGESIATEDGAVQGQHDLFITSGDQAKPEDDAAPEQHDSSATVDADTITQETIPSQPLYVPSSTVVTTAPQAIALNGSVPEFLFQLMKMLTDDNREIIEWSNGRIEVHSPQKLQSVVLNRYFRHSKFASFQRQLNYFGFRKLAGKGKMSPCSYVNDNVRGDLSNLLVIKRKTGPTGSAKDSATMKKQRRTKSPPQVQSLAPAVAVAPVKPVLADIARSSSSCRRSPRNKFATDTPAGILARKAVGKGIRHGFVYPPTDSANPTAVNNNLAELESNYRISLNTSPTSDPDIGFHSFLSRESSLVDLAIIPQPDNDREPGDGENAVDTFNFVDFPNPEVDPLACMSVEADDVMAREVDGALLDEGKPPPPPPT